MVVRQRPAIDAGRNVHVRYVARPADKLAFNRTVTLRDT
jgi:hypothetical protein